MARYIEDGTYEAEGVAASVYRKENGNVILQTEWAIPSLRKTIRNWDCVIIGNTGEIREKAMANIKKWAVGWDGTTFGWFPANIATCRVELVIENQPATPPEYDENGNPKTVSRVKWVNPIGGGGNQKEMQADESAALDRLFAAKLRANAGARPVGGAANVVKPAAQVAKPVTVKPATPAPAGMPQKAASLPSDAPEAEAAPIVPSTREEAWRRFCEIAEGAKLGAEERNAKFLDLVAQIGKQTDYDNWTGDDWGRLVAAIDDWNVLPF